MKENKLKLLRVMAAYLTEKDSSETDGSNEHGLSTRPVIAKKKKKGKIRGLDDRKNEKLI